VGERVARGDRLLSIEAMKMETGVFAERDGVVREVLVGAGTQVDTKQLLMVVGDEEEAPGEGDGAPG
jgi:pyruvate carboxylase